MTTTIGLVLGGFLVGLLLGDKFQPIEKAIERIKKFVS